MIDAGIEICLRVEFVCFGHAGYICTRRLAVLPGELPSWELPLEPAASSASAPCQA